MTLRRAGLLAAIVLALLAIRCADGFRADEMECEEAMSHLAMCCSGFEKDQASCTYSDGSCGTSIPVTAVFSVDESHCIQHESCAELVSTSVCDRARHLPYIPPSSSTPQPVCP